MLKPLLSLLLALTVITVSACGSIDTPANDSGSTDTDALTSADSTNTDADDAVNTESDTSEINVSFPYSFTDDSGEVVTLDAEPTKVAVLFSSYAEIWTDAGGSVAVTVAETVERGFADDSVTVIDPGSGHSTIDLEALISAEPDFVIGTTDYAGQVDAVSFCRGVGIPAALFRVECFDDYLDVLEIFCDIAGSPENYELYGTSVESEIDALFDSVCEYLESADAPDILFVRAGSTDSSTKAKTAADNFACAMLDELGVNNIADERGELTGALSLEAIIEADPDYMFITTMGNEAAAIEHMDSMLTSEGWRELSCVKESNYAYLPKELFHFKPNSRWADAYKMLVELLYPELVVE